MNVSEKYNIKNTDKKLLKKWFSLMVLGRTLDERAPNYLKQALGWSYHAPYAGHDGIQLAIGQTFEKNKDHLFPYYRDTLTVLSAGMTAEEIILNESEFARQFGICLSYKFAISCETQVGMCTPFVIDLIS